VMRQGPSVWDSISVVRSRPWSALLLWRCRRRAMLRGCPSTVHEGVFRDSAHIPCFESLATQVFPHIAYQFLSSR
jgi:hypothetical protein